MALNVLVKVMENFVVEIEDNTKYKETDWWEITTTGSG